MADCSWCFSQFILFVIFENNCEFRPDQKHQNHNSESFGFSFRLKHEKNRTFYHFVACSFLCLCANAAQHELANYCRGKKIKIGKKEKVWSATCFVVARPKTITVETVAAMTQMKILFINGNGCKTRELSIRLQTISLDESTATMMMRIHILWWWNWFGKRIHSNRLLSYGKSIIQSAKSTLFTVHCKENDPKY